MEDNPDMIYTIYKESYQDRNLVYVNCKSDPIGILYSKSQVEEFFIEGIWKEPKDSFVIYEDED